MRELGRGFVLMVAVVVAGSEARAREACERRVVDLPVLDGACCSFVAGINERGDVVGSSETGPRIVPPGSRFPQVFSHAVVWRDGKIIDLGTLGGDGSEGTGINDRGEVTGNSGTANGQAHAFLWRKGEMIDLGTLGGTASFASGINDRGEVVGSSSLAGDTAEHAFVWRDGTMTDLGSLGGGLSHASAINHFGVITGTDLTVPGGFIAPVRWVNGVEVPMSDQQIDPFAINDRGQIVGAVSAATVTAFFWDAGTFTTLTSPAGVFAAARAINDRGEIAGEISPDAVVWEHGQPVILPRLGEGFAAGVAINNRGEVAGLSALSADGNLMHAVVWKR
jgi:probable HAF family extracellular repeat protein